MSPDLSHCPRSFSDSEFLHALRRERHLAPFPSQRFAGVLETGELLHANYSSFDLLDLPFCFPRYTYPCCQRDAVSGFGLTKHQAANRLFTTLRHAVLCPYVCVQFSLPHPRWAQKKRMALKWTQSSFRDREEDNSPSGRTSRSTMGATTTSTWKKERLTAKAVLGATPISNPRGTQTSRRKTLFKGRLCGAEPVSLVFQ